MKLNSLFSVLLLIPISFLLFACGSDGGSDDEVGGLTIPINTEWVSNCTNFGGDSEYGIYTYTFVDNQIVEENALSFSFNSTCSGAPDGIENIKYLYKLGNRIEEAESGDIYWELDLTEIEFNGVAIPEEEQITEYTIIRFNEIKSYFKLGYTDGINLPEGDTPETRHNTLDDFTQYQKTQTTDSGSTPNGGNTGNSNEPASPGPFGMISVTGPDTALLGNSFVPTSAGRYYSSTAYTLEFKMPDDQFGTKAFLIFGSADGITAVNYTRGSYIFLMDCHSLSDKRCDVVDVDLANKTVTLDNFAVPPNELSQNPTATDAVSVSGTLSWVVDQPY